MTITFNPANLAQTRSDLGLAIGTDVLAPNGSGANLTGIAPDLSSDIRSLALQTAADRIGLDNGIADPFTDNSDVSTGDSTNFTHDATASSFSSFSTGDMFDVSGITITTSPSFTYSAQAYNNDLTNSSYHAGAPSNSYYQIDLGSGNALSAVSYTVGMWNNGISSQYGTVFTYKLQASNDGASFTDIDSRSSVTHNGALSSSQIKYSFSKTTAYRYWRFVIVSSNGTYTGIGNIEIEYADISNGTLVSNAFTADSAPSNSIVGVQVVENESITINTDLTAEVSRDNGTTFTACTLSLKSTLGASGTKYYESASTDISSQPSGTSMKYRIKTLNTKDIEVHGVALKWS